MGKWMKFRGEGDVGLEELGEDSIKLVAGIFRQLGVDQSPHTASMTDAEVFAAMSNLARCGFLDFRLKLTRDRIKVRSCLMDGKGHRASAVVTADLMLTPDTPLH